MSKTIAELDKLNSKKRTSVAELNEAKRLKKEEAQKRRHAGQLASKKMGPPKGNLNYLGNEGASYMAVIRRLEVGKKLPGMFGRVTAIVESEAASLVSDAGGVENLSGATMLEITVWKSARSMELLGWLEALERGSVVMEQDGVLDFQPILHRIGQFLSIQNKVLMNLGLTRKPRAVEDLRTFVENYEVKK